MLQQSNVQVTNYPCEECNTVFSLPMTFDSNFTARPIFSFSGRHDVSRYVGPNLHVGVNARSGLTTPNSSHLEEDIRIGSLLQ